MPLRRTRTTLWHTSDGEAFHTREEAEAHENAYMLGALIHSLTDDRFTPGQAHELAVQLVSHRETFRLVFLPGVKP